MTGAQPTVSWEVLQRRKLEAMSETVPHFKEMAGLRIYIEPNVYPPGTDTHLLANTVKISPNGTALDLCTGTGAIACKLSALGAKSVVAVDLNPLAVANAQKNVELLGLKNVAVRKGNMFEGIKDKFDVVSINPPYTNKAASSDIDICFYDKDHQFIRDFFAGLRAHLKPAGTVYLAWSNISDMDLLPKLANHNGFEIQELSKDVGRRGYTFYIYQLKDKK